jgi:TfoX/Sxy family transcriptional regulator of competence genes
MAFSHSLAARTRDALTGVRSIEEKKMFGGLAFLLHGNVLVGVWENSLLVRLGAEDAEQALLEPDVREFDITGKPMKGWAVVEPDGIENDQQLKKWVERAEGFVRTLPRK